MKSPSTCWLVGEDRLGVVQLWKDEGWFRCV
jgi:hypothetical protein